MLRVSFKVSYRVSAHPLLFFTRWRFVSGIESTWPTPLQIFARRRSLFGLQGTCPTQLCGLGWMSWLESTCPTSNLTWRRSIRFREYPTQPLSMVIMCWRSVWCSSGWYLAQANSTSLDDGEGLCGEGLCGESLKPYSDRIRFTGGDRVM
jgi:hypothetical protein